MENLCKRTIILPAVPEQAVFVHQKIHAGGVQDPKLRILSRG